MSAEAKRLAASALNLDYPDTALLAAVESTKLEQSPETYGALLTLLARQPEVVHRVRTPNRYLVHRRQPRRSHGLRRREQRDPSGHRHRERTGALDDLGERRRAGGSAVADG